MAIPLDPKPIVSFDELLMSRVVQQEATTGLFIKKGILIKAELLEMLKEVDREMKLEERGVIS